MYSVPLAHGIKWEKKQNKLSCSEIMNLRESFATAGEFNLLFTDKKWAWLWKE